MMDTTDELTTYQAVVAGGQLIFSCVSVRAFTSNAASSLTLTDISALYLEDVLLACLPNLEHAFFCNGNTSEVITQHLSLLLYYSCLH